MIAVVIVVAFFVIVIVVVVVVVVVSRATAIPMILPGGSSSPGQGFYRNGLDLVDGYSVLVDFDEPIQELLHGILGLVDSSKDVWNVVGIRIRM